MRYEYEIEIFEHGDTESPDKVMRQLFLRGHAGWALCGIDSDPVARCSVYVFRREIVPVVERVPVEPLP